MHPTSEADLADAIATAQGALRIQGGATRDIGAPVIGTALSTQGLDGIVDYEPGALTLVARAGTPQSLDDLKHHKLIGYIPDMIYDEELEQVTVKPLNQAIARTPAMVLSSGDSVARHYEVTDLGERDGLAWLRLVPRAPDTDYEHMRLGFGGDVLRAMELEDGFGQITRLNFSDIDHDAAVDPAWFRFEPPPGVDVIEGH